MDWSPRPPARRLITDRKVRDSINYHLCDDTALWWDVLTPLRRVTLRWDMMCLLEILSERGEDGLLGFFQEAVDFEALPPGTLRKLREGAVEARKLPIWGEDHGLDLQALKAWLEKEEKALGAQHRRMQLKQAIRNANRRKRREEQ